uniref:Kazal-like domain-containing protein n=1 Tax=Crocodylus porosus TaxID=8502 RepID=A0A7M4FZL4_CROPO
NSLCCMRFPPKRRREKQCPPTLRPEETGRSLTRMCCFLCGSNETGEGPRDGEEDRQWVTQHSGRVRGEAVPTCPSLPQANCSKYHLTQDGEVSCPKNFHPVCGTDNALYSNECMLCREILHGKSIDKKHDGRCVQGVDCTGYLETPPGETAICTMDYRPICGTDGITYGNPCTFCTAIARSGGKLQFKHYGVC